MKYIKDSIKAFVILTAIVLASCSTEPIGPPDDKVRMDMDEKIAKLSQDLIDVTEFEINSREKIAEDRVKLHITVKLNINKEKMDYFKKRTYKMFGPRGGPNVKRIREVEKMDKKVELATWQYELDQSGGWLLSQTETGHH